MKKLYFIALVVLSTVSISSLNGSARCVSSSRSLKTSPDFKNYKPVAGGCTCPCERYLHADKRDKCFVCGHSRVPEQQIIVHTSKKELKKPTPLANRYLTPMPEIIKELHEHAQEK